MKSLWRTLSTVAIFNISLTFVLYDTANKSQLGGVKNSMRSIQFKSAQQFKILSVEFRNDACKVIDENSGHIASLYKKASQLNDLARADGDAVCKLIELESATLVPLYQEASQLNDLARACGKAASMVTKLRGDALFKTADSNTKCNTPFLT